MFNDNESAVVVATRCRAHSAPMSESSKAFIDIQRRTGRRVRFISIPGEKNAAACALSREGGSEAAFTDLWWLGYTPRVVAAPPEFFNWLRRIGSAARVRDGTPAAHRTA